MSTSLACDSDGGGDVVVAQAVQEVGGGLVDDGDLYPAVVALAPPGGSVESRFCSGTLVTPNRVVSAAHCFTPNSVSGPLDVLVVTHPGGVKTVTTYTHRSTFASGVQTNVVRTFTTPGPTGGDSNGDIAVITLDSPVPDVTPMEAATPDDPCPRTTEFIATERPADEAPSAWSITALALGWGGLPYVGLSGELGLSQHIGASLVLGTWYWTASDDRAPPILYSGYTHRVGTNAAVYPFGGLEGLRLGLEAAYAVSTNDAVHGPRVREESLGVGFAMFIGHKMIRKSGFTFVADVGMGDRTSSSCSASGGPAEPTFPGVEPVKDGIDDARGAVDDVEGG